MSHVCIVGALPRSLTNFRGALIASLVAAGHRVTAMAGNATDEESSAIEALGVSFRTYPVHRHLSPWQDARTYIALRAAFRDLRPDLVLAYTIKPIVWGGLALRGLRGPRFVALFTGIGFAFQGSRGVRGLLTRVTAWLTRRALARADVIVFQNADNRDLLVSLGAADPARARVVPGSGIDTKHFLPASFPAGNTVFLVVARLLGEKGLREYAEAARLVRQRHPQAVFRMLGPEDSSPDAVPLSEVRSWERAGAIEYLGEATDVRPFIANCHVLVLPSYHEGMPRSVLEGMAMGRPILTTNVPGCRETVVQNENGFLVARGDAAALAERMVWFIEHREALDAMGAASRRMAEERFDVIRVNREMLSLLNLQPGTRR